MVDSSATWHSDAWETAAQALSTKKDFIEAGPLREFKRYLVKQYESIDKAFETIDGCDELGGGVAGASEDKKITPLEFTKVLEKLQYKGDATVIYKLLDTNQDEGVTEGEFKARLAKKQC